MLSQITSVCGRLSEAVLRVDPPLKAVDYNRRFPGSDRGLSVMTSSLPRPGGQLDMGDAVGLHHPGVGAFR